MSSQTYYDNNRCESNESVPSTSRNARDMEIKKKRQALITNMFPSQKMRDNFQNNQPSTSKSSETKPNEFIVSHKLTINGVNVVLPVKPYKCQIAVMSKVITAIKEGTNCLLESPTGTGKTLALLCGALAWQQQEKNRLIKQQEDEACLQHPDFKNLQNSTSTDTSPQKNIALSEIQFVKPIYGNKSIYDVPIEECNFSYAKKRKDLLDDSFESDGLVGIVKKARTSEVNEPPNLLETKELNTDKDINQDAIDQKLLGNLQEQISMIVDCSLPVIYYGVRTHKQLEQVVQEFTRVEYAKACPMSILSSRNQSCIREFDKSVWATKNDMCKSCTKTTSTSTNRETNCDYFTNYKALKHSTLPPTFDLKKLISEGKRIRACPYYAARRMGTVAQIVFCPYNYLIEPSIRKNMQIQLERNIVIIDEGHNIEDVCREAASFTFKQTDIENALMDLITAAGLRFANKDVINYVEYLKRALEEWSSWFLNHTKLMEKQPVNDVTAEYLWDVKNFVNTLDNHNIGPKNYPDFSKNAKIFCKKFRDDPRQLIGITQATSTLIENLDTVFGYLYRNSGHCMEDYKPVLIRKLRSPVTGRMSKSNFDEVAKFESLSLSVLCLNPGVVFAELRNARSVLLASGTLTPMNSLHSELDTTFAYAVSPKHVFDNNRVWVGSLGGPALQFDYKSSRTLDSQDELGRVLQRVCDVTPHGVLCFLPSYQLMNNLYLRWRNTQLWDKLNIVKDVFKESISMEEHDMTMKKYYRSVTMTRGALLLAVYRGKVAEGMDFKDHQARAVILVGVPFPAQNVAVKEKMNYNKEKYAKNKNFLSGHEWFKVQAYRALNQAAGRVVRHSADWGAVLLVDSRYAQLEYRTHLSGWIGERLGDRQYDCNTLFNNENSLSAFMTRMKKEG